MNSEKSIFLDNKKKVIDNLKFKLKSEDKTFLIVSKNCVENKGAVKEVLDEKYKYDKKTVSINLMELDNYNIFDQEDRIEKIVTEKFEELVEEGEGQNKKTLETKPTKKARVGFFDFIGLLIGLGLIGLAYLNIVVNYLKDKTVLTQTQILAINIAIYCIGALWVIVFIISVFEAIRGKAQTKEEKPAKDKKSKSKETKKCRKDTLYISGVREYVNKFDESDRDRVLDAVKRVYTQLYSWLKKNNEVKFITVWDDKILVSPDLTLLVFDKVVEIDPDFEIMERGHYLVDALVEEGVLVNVKRASGFAKKMGSYKVIDKFVKECSNVFSNIDENIDGTKFVFIQYLKMFQKTKFDSLSQHFVEKDTPVRVNKITLTKSEFNLYGGNGIEFDDESSDDIVIEVEEEVTTEKKVVPQQRIIPSSIGYNFDLLKYPKYLNQAGFDFASANIEDDLNVLIKYVLKQDERMYYKFCNLELLNHLIQIKDIKLLKKIMYSVVNVEYNECATCLKFFYNGLVKNEKAKGYQSSALLLRYFYQTILDVEDGREIEYTDLDNRNYIENRSLIFKMIEYVHQNARKFEYVKVNDKAASEIIFRKN